MVKNIIFILLIFIGNNIAQAQQVYKPHNCEYSVSFPSKPKLSLMFDPTLGEYKSAEILSGNSDNAYLLRVQCLGGLDLKDKKLNTKEFLKKQIIAYTESNGIQNAEYHFENSNLGKSARSRGYKKIGDTMVTYEAMIYVGKTSFLMLHVGGTSKSYPQPQVSKFLRSIDYEEFLTLK